MAKPLLGLTGLSTEESGQEEAIPFCRFIFSIYFDMLYPLQVVGLLIELNKCTLRLKKFSSVLPLVIKVVIVILIVVIEIVVIVVIVLSVLLVLYSTTCL